MESQEFLNPKNIADYGLSLFLIILFFTSIVPSMNKLKTRISDLEKTVLSFKEALAPIGVDVAESKKAVNDMRVEIGKSEVLKQVINNLMDKVFVWKRNDKEPPA